MAEANARAATEETFDGVGGLKIFLRSWRPDGKPRAVVVICHGVNSHGGQYVWVAEQFVKSGFAVYALDLRGRGKSEGERFYVENVADYVSDVAGVVKIAKSRDPGLPVFLLGHSAGGVVSCVYTLDNQTELAGFICESFAFQVPAPGFALAAIKGLSHIAPRLPVLKLKNEDFSRDPKAVETLNSDPLIAHEVQPAITVAALLRADERLREEFPLHDPAGADHARHRRQGHRLPRQRVLLRDRRLEGQDAEALRGALPRPPQRHRQGRGLRRHQGLDRQAPAGMSAAGKGAELVSRDRDARRDPRRTRQELGADFTPYRNHTYRVANLCVAQTSGGAEAMEKIAIAAAFHDLGIWTDHTFDYLQPSVRLAQVGSHLRAEAAWTPEITEMILEHHKVTRYRDQPGLAGRAIPALGLDRRYARRADLRRRPNG